MSRQVYSFTFGEGGQYGSEGAARNAAMAKLSSTPGALPQLQRGRVCPGGAFECDDEVTALQVVVPATGGRRRKTKNRKNSRNTKSRKNSRKTKSRKNSRKTSRR